MKKRDDPQVTRHEGNSARTTAGRPDGETCGLGGTVSERTDLVGHQLGEYQILAVIGSGGGGNVYRARHLRMERHVAVKVLPPALTSDPTMEARFLREVKTSARLLHQHIVTAFDAGTYQDMHYLVMELVEGKSFAEIVRLSGVLSIDDTIEYTLQAAKGLAHAHQHQVVHRDVKPSNIMCNDQQVVKILDMGLAHLRDRPSTMSNISGHGLTEHGLILGTIDYMSPEQANDAHQVDLRTDIYSLGCTVHYLLTGRPIYSGRIVEIMFGHARGPIPSLKDIRSDTPSPLDELFQRMVAKNPNDRPNSMHEIIEALEHCKQQAPSSEAAPAAPALDRSLPLATQPVPDTTAGRILSIDVGNYAARSATLSDHGDPVILTADGNPDAMRSVVAIGDGKCLVGKDALVHTAANHDFRRHLGQPQAKQSSKPEIPPEVLTAVMLRKVAEHSRTHHGYFPHCVLTVPGCFDEPGRKAIRDAGYIASLDVLDTINESSAVAIHFAHSRGLLNPNRAIELENWLILHLGSGSCEAAVMQFRGEELNTVAITGDAQFGCCEWDQRIAESLTHQFAISQEQIAENPALEHRIRIIAQQARQRLTQQPSVKLRYQLSGRTCEARLDRDQLNHLGLDLVQKLRGFTEQAVNLAPFDLSQLDQVVLSGGGGYLPAVRTLLTEFTGGPPRQIDEFGPVQGAALWASMFVDSQGYSRAVRIKERNPVALSVVAYDRKGKPKKVEIAKANAELPATRRITFRTMQAQQGSAQLQIILGDSPVVSECKLLGECSIFDLPHGTPAGEPMEVEFQIAANGQLLITSELVTTGRRVPVQINRRTGLTEEARTRWRDWLDNGLLCGLFDELPTNGED